MKAAFEELAQINKQRAESGKLYREFLRVPSMSAGLYVLPAGGTDPQRPHHEDEMYYVVRGRARFRAGDDDKAVSAGAILLPLRLSTGSMTLKRNLLCSCRRRRVEVAASEGCRHRMRHFLIPSTSTKPDTDVWSFVLASPPAQDDTPLLAGFLRYSLG